MTKIAALIAASILGWVALHILAGMKDRELAKRIEAGDYTIARERGITE